LLVSDDVLDARREALGGAYAPKARDRKVSAALRAYAAMATSADKGAVRDVSKLG
jgi:dihydroxy-acid dehydratase